MKEILKMFTDNDRRIPRMRTISEAAAELRALDKNSAITPYFVRQLCIKGVLPTVKAGKKILLNFNDLLEYMNDPTADKFKPRTESTSKESGVIRRIAE